MAATCDTNNIYRIECDPDVNEYGTEDAQDLVLANLGQAGREVGVIMPLFILMIAIGIVLGLILRAKMTGKKIAK